MMRTNKAVRYYEQKDREIDKIIAQFSQHLMSNSKWIRLINMIVENTYDFKKIQFKKIENANIGELFINEDSIFESDYWQKGFEGNNSLGGWLEYKEIEFLIFPEIINSKVNQDLLKIEKHIRNIGEFCIEYDDNKLKLICYKR